jgi:hypothetical protein
MTRQEALILKALSGFFLFTLALVIIAALVIF